MVALVGEQPIPNLLPLRHLRQDRVHLVYTDRTKKMAGRLAGVIGHSFCESWETDPYDVGRIRVGLEQCVKQQEGEDEILFNLTGGTKAMAFAALEVARKLGAPVLYFQSERGRSRLYFYRWSAGCLELDRDEEVAGAVTADEFLRLYVGEYTRKPDYANDLERQVGGALARLGQDYDLLTNVYLVGIGSNVEVDFVLARRNQFAVGEVKRKASKAEGIDQLLAVTDQRTLGTYTRRILVTTHDLDTNSANLAGTHRIRVVVLGSAREGVLSAEDQDRLLAAIREEMEPAREAWG
jgi:hypothetical protein